MEMIKRFFAGYFHEDWMSDADGFVDVLDKYLKEGFSELEIINLINGIQEIKIKLSTEPETEAENYLFYKLGCYYSPKTDGYKVVEWMEKLIEHLRKRIRKSI